MSFTLYESNPWSGVATNKREFYDPVLRDWYVREAIYGRFVTTQFNLAGDVRTTKMTITRLIPPHPNFDQLALRQLWMPSSYIDSEQREITFGHYGGKLSMHAYDNLVTYWQQNNQQGLVGIINAGLGVMMVGVMDMLARNAFLSGAFALYGQGTGTGFNNVSSADTLTTTLIDDIHLGMAYRGVPYASSSDGSSPYGTIFCITSPGVIRDLRYEDSTSGANNFIDVMKYAAPGQIVNNEVGSYHNVRFISTPNAVLWNCGPITTQTTIAAPVSAGDGAPDPALTKVDGAYLVGQPGTNATHYITVASASGFAVNDEVSIHVLRTNQFGVTDGVDFRDGKLHLRRIVSINGNNITFDRPIMEDFKTELSSGVYGYVTKGRHIHTAVFVGGQDGVVMGVADPPRVRIVPPIDDFMAMYRASWSGRFGYTVFEPRVFEVVFCAGSNRVRGPRYRG